MPTSANPHIAPEEIESARQDLTEMAFAQEYLAQFVTWTGAVFRKITNCIGNPSGRAVTIGVDWGRTNDSTVYCVLSDAGAVLELDRFCGLEYQIQRDRLKALWERHGKPSIVAESNAMGTPVIEQLRADGLTVKAFTTTTTSKAAIIERLALAFEQGTITIPNDPVLIGELQAFEASPLASGTTRYAAPQGLHDDTVMALAIAYSDLDARVRRSATWPKDIDPFGNLKDLTRPSAWDLHDSSSETARWRH
jgi:hypothetical protein